MHLCPVLASRLGPGCRIYNVNPSIFQCIITHLKLISTYMSTFEQTQWLSTPGHLRELTRTFNPPQTFVQAWHLGGMLRLPNLQNDITKVFYNSCVGFLNRCPGSLAWIDPAPFMYLTTMCGRGTKAELFLFDFNADFMRNPGTPHGLFQNLPMFVQLGITNSGYQVRMRDGIGQSGDRVGWERYAVREDDGTHYGELQIQPAARYAHPPA
jgi:hypothetical protein